jgi:hypothetical protein
MSPLIESSHKNDFDEWLARIICYAFAHDPEKWKPVFRTDHASLKHDGRRSLRSEAITLYGRRNGR